MISLAAALAALVVPLAAITPAVAAGTGVLTITMEPVDVTTGAPQTWAGMNGAVSTQLGYRISYSCSVSDCLGATIQVSPGPLDPTYNNYRHLLYGSWTAPFLGATIGGTDTTGKLVALGNVAAGASGSFTINYQWGTLGSANSSTMQAAQFFPNGFPILMSATAASTSISNSPTAAAAPVEWRSSILDPSLGISTANPQSKDAGAEVTYSVTMNSGCLPTRETAAKGDSRYTCAKSYTVTDKLDPRATWVGASNGGVYDASTHSVIWTVAPAPGITFPAPAPGWYSPGSSNINSPRTVTVRYDPEAFSPSGADTDFCDFTQPVTSTVSMHMVYLGAGGMADDGNFRDVTATRTHNVVCVSPFAKATFNGKFSTYDGPSRYSNGDSPVVVQPDADPNLQHWDIGVGNQANVPGVAVIADPNLAIEGTRPTQIQAVNANGLQQNDATIAWTLNDSTTGTSMGVATAPPGTWFTAMTVTSGPLAGPNLLATDTLQTQFLARVNYTVTGDAPIDQVRTNTATAKMTYPGYPTLADIDLGSRSHTLHYLAPFGRVALEKMTDTSAANVNLLIPTSGSTSHFWRVIAYNTGNVPGVATVDEPDLGNKPVKVTQILQLSNNVLTGSSVQYTLNTTVTGTAPLPFTAPAGTWITAAHVTSPVLQPVNALITQSVTSYYELRFVYSIPSTTVDGSSWTNTASGRVTYPNMGIADVPFTDATKTVTFGSAVVLPQINAAFAGAPVVQGGGAPVPGRDVTYTMRGASANVPVGSTFSPQYVFIAPANWAITQGSPAFAAGTVPAGVTFTYKTVVVAGVTRQAVMASWPAGVTFGANATWPSMTVVAQPTALAAAGTSSTAQVWAGEASNNWSTSAATYGSAVSDSADFDGDGVTTEGFATANSSALIVGSASQLTVIKEICFPNPSATDGCDWVAQPGAVVGVNPAASNIEYRVRLINSGNTSLTNLVAYDVLPYIGDTGTSAAASGTPRNSTFQEQINQIVTSTGVTLAYSASTNPCRAEVYPAGPVGCTNDWNTSAGAASGAQAIRMTATAAIAPGAQVLVHYKAAVIPGAPADAIACNSVAAKATQIGVPAEPLAVCATTQEADLELEVPVRLPLQLNRPGILPFTVTNLGGSQSAPAIVDVDVPAGVRVNSLTPAGWSCASSTAGIDGPLTLTCSAVDGTGAARTLTKNVADPLNIPVVPTAGTSVCLDGDAHGRMSDPDLTNNDASACFTIAAATAGVSLTKNDAKSNVSRGDQYTYTITATNALVGETLPGVVITDTLPAGLEFVAASDGGALVGGVVTWPAVDLGASGTATGGGTGQTGGTGSIASRTVTVRVLPTAVGSITNAATATAPDPVDPAVSITATADDTDQLLMYTVTKTVNASAEGVYDGDELTYTVVVENLGTAPLAGAQVHDNLTGVLDDAAFVPGSGQVTVTGQSPVAVADPVGGKLNWTGTLAAGASATITYRVTVGDAGDGALSNTAFTSAGATCDPATGLDENAAPCASTMTYFAPLIAKTVSSLVQNDNGTWSIGYDIDVTNRNPVASIGYALADSLAFGPGIGASGASVLSGPAGVTLAPWSGSGAITGVVTLPAGATHHYELTATADAHDLGGTPAATCTDGVASGFSNTASLALASGRTVDTSTCAEPTEATVAKTSTPATQNPDGTFTLVYALTVTGPSDAPTGGLAYTLDDQFGFPAGVQVAAVDVTGPAGAPINPAFLGSGNVLTGADRIGANQVRTFTVTVTTNVPANSVTGSDLACPPAGSGGYANEVSLHSGTSATVLDTATACERAIALPTPLIAKTVESSSVDGVSGDWTIVYGITVTNPDAQYLTSYDLTDDLTYGAGITVVSAQATSPDATVSGTWDGAADTTLASGIPLPASAVHHFTVTVVATPPGVIDDANAADMDCRLDAGEAGTGFRNLASISSVATPAPVAEACEAATDPSVVKATAGVPTQDPATGVWTIVYKVTVTNRSTTTVAGGVPYSVDDSFGFPAGVTVASVDVAGPGTVNAGFDGDTDTALASGSIDAAASDTVPERHVYTVTVTFEADGGLDINDRTCDPAGAAGGLLNTAEIRVGVRTTAAVACADVPDAPVVGVTKTVLSQQQQSDGTWVVLYRLAVANPSLTVSGFYDLDDEFAVGAGMTVDSASIVARPTGVTPNPSFDGAGDTSISEHILLGGGASHLYTVRAVIDAGGVRGSDAAGDCTLTGGETGTGFMNTAIASSGAADRDATACVTAFDPAISKTVNGQPVQGADGSWTVKYVITVTNPSPLAGLFYELQDELDFPAGTAFGTTTVTARTSGPATSATWNGTSDLIAVPAGAALAAGTSHVFDVTVVATLPAGQASQVGGWANGASVLSGTGGIIASDANAAADIELPELTVTKMTTGAGVIAIGDTVDYTVHVENTGIGDFTTTYPADVWDDLVDVLDDATLSGGPAASIGSATIAIDKLHWLGALGAGQSADIDYSVTVTAAGNQSLHNVAFAGSPGTTPATPDPCAGIACASTLTSLPAFLLEKTASTGVAAAGDTVDYTITFTNTGLVDVTGATFTDDLSDVLDDSSVPTTPVASVGTATLAGSGLTWVGDLAAGDAVTVTYSVTAVNPMTGNGMLVNTATADPRFAAPDRTVQTQTGIRSIAFTKTADAVQAVPGQKVTYTVTVTNIGKADYTAIDPATVVDSMSGVLDDGKYNADASATAGAATYTAPELEWKGPIAAGASVTIRYSITLNPTMTGDRKLDNIIGVAGTTLPASTLSTCLASPTDNAQAFCLVTLAVAPLAYTGVANSSIPLLVALLVLLIGVVLVLIRARRREKTLAG